MSHFPFQNSDIYHMHRAMCHGHNYSVGWFHTLGIPRMGMDERKPFIIDLILYIPLYSYIAYIYLYKIIYIIIYI
jgi:hypothetical protein